MDPKKTLTPTQYHYLVIISKLSTTLNQVKSIDVAVDLGVSRATVSRTLSQLIKEGYVYRNQRTLTLTSKAISLLQYNKTHYSTLLQYFSQINLDSLEVATISNVLCDYVPNHILDKFCDYIKSQDE